ncbi:hypothetical protein CF15_05525 [Pyrodictium occultum]|uniref:Aspartyl/glutamyl-tRNA(Asn/Gln) amidotransferase subunit C n=1 Tax=Pyrodictium occultum TaxID=2309 RepID=A0A0V8RW18_PYROC|nr:Asp-tRNA(Asn)/Glu-tRNA(Gln) amidotransferase subunit GatC [Pyrodictium occultum]KSW12216.1 hypothetical protein CF15_05525 [Pyrodictium occultum]
MASREDMSLEKLAWLSRISLGEEAEELRRRIERARRLIDKLLEARLEGVEPLYHSTGSEGLLREDKPSGSLDRERALLNAARVEKGFVVAPRTVEE